jgi:hypothetical protein|nr:hypothetical protein [uncultured Emticicia sp.]
MKKTIQLLLFTSVFSLFAVSCKKDSELTKKNMFNHDNKDYELSNAYLSNYGYEYGIYLIDIIMTSSDVKVAEKNGEVFPISGIGNLIGFFFFKI